MIIIGAGMAGCLAGVMNPRATLLEASGALPDTHKAVLRFREDKISKATGIPFRKVHVQKGIWLDGKSVAPSIRNSNLYSRKVADGVLARSINNISATERYVAPYHFHKELAALCAGRIVYGARVKAITNDSIQLHPADEYQNPRPGAVPRSDSCIISTMPLPALCLLLGIEHGQQFHFKGIHVQHYQVPGADAFQTIYFPSPETPIYRATLTSDNLIVESIDKIHPQDIVQVADSFGINHKELQLRSASSQQYGKIAPIDDGVRKGLLLQLTMRHNIFSLGRFACWRNILLDDVYDDIFRIKSMIGQHHYDIKREASK